MGTELNPVSQTPHHIDPILDPHPREGQGQQTTISMLRSTGANLQQQQKASELEQQPWELQRTNHYDFSGDRGDEEKLIDGSAGSPAATNSIAGMLFGVGRNRIAVLGGSDYNLVSHGRDFVRSLCSSKPSAAIAASGLAFFALLFLAIFHFARSSPFAGYIETYNQLHSSDNIASFQPPPISDFVSRPSFNCSELGLKEEKVILEEQQYHVFPTSEVGIKGSCQSKYQQHCFRKNTGPKFHPSREFVSVLREYEAYHERCTRGFDLTDLANKGHAPENCTYLVWKTMDGMGNQLLSIVSAFVYSLLTNRAMLISTDSHIEQYLCNPFPLSSWVIPEGFPANALRDGSRRLFDYLNEVMDKLSTAGDACSSRGAGGRLSELIAEAPSRIQVYITCCDERRDHQFFCPTAQKLLRGVNWVYYQSHEYTLSAFYFVPEFREKLKQWFPSNDVFMHAARYVLNPNNEIWGRVKELYREHMDGKGRKVGVQPRSWTGGFSDKVDRQIRRCVVEEKLLPGTVGGPAMKANASGEGEEVAVQVASLRAEYADNLAMEYGQHETEDGSRVRVFSASSEGAQRTGDAAHDASALVDIWLLSFAQEMVITPSSTFGSTASGIAGVVPFVFVNYDEDKLQEPACLRSNLAGPCFLVYPVNQPCDLDPARSSIFDPSLKVPEVTYCQHNRGLGVQNII